MSTRTEQESGPQPKSLSCMELGHMLVSNIDNHHRAQKEIEQDKNLPTREQSGPILETQGQQLAEPEFRRLNSRMASSLRNFIASK